MKIAVVGTGYVGLVSGTCFAEMGNNVTCVDIDEKKVEKMKNGEVPIYEPQLDILFERNISQKRLHFTTSLADAIRSGAVSISVPSRSNTTIFWRVRFIIFITFAIICVKNINIGMFYMVQ